MAETRAGPVAETRFTFPAVFIISPPAGALGREENKPASQQSEPFRPDEPSAGIFPRKRSPTVVTVRLLFDERAVNTFLMWGWGRGGAGGEVWGLAAWEKTMIWLMPKL